MQCPGQDSRYWGPDAAFETECPRCGQVVEFFKDEPTHTCKSCGAKIVNPKMDFGCVSYCQFAEQCLGDLPPEVLARNKELLKDRVAVEMKRYFAFDFRRIGHAMKVARYAGTLTKHLSAEPAVALSAAYLHDIGILEAERKHQSTDAPYQEQEGPPIAREILTGLKAPEPLIDEVCDIIGHHHHPRAEETSNFKAVYDADIIVNLEEAAKKTPVDPAEMKSMIDEKVLTEAGRQLAIKILLKSTSD